MTVEESKKERSEYQVLYIHVELTIHRL